MSKFYLENRVLERPNALEEFRGSVEKFSGKYWWFDYGLRGEIRAVVFEERLYSGETKYQKVDILRSPVYGECLFLDGELQLAESDEYIYHEMIVHPAMLAHPNPERILILGGGDGCIAREVLRYSGVREVKMIDLDGELVELYRERFTRINRRALRDPRIEISIEDGRAFLERSTEQWDVIIADLTDPCDYANNTWDERISALLYTEDFYQLVASRLSDNGIFVTQSMSLMLQPSDRFHFQVLENMKRVFPYVWDSCEYITSWMSAITATFASKIDYKLESWDPEERLKERGIEGLKYYSSAGHRRLFSLPLVFQPKSK